MTVNRNYTEVAYTGNGTTKIFNFDFSFIDKEVVVYLEYEDRSEKYLLPFEVKGNFRNQGGEVIFQEAIEIGQMFTIRREIDILQNSEYRNNNLNTIKIEEDFDKQIMILQIINDLVSRTIRLKSKAISKVDQDLSLNELYLNNVYDQNTEKIVAITLKYNETTGKWEFGTSKQNPDHDILSATETTEGVVLLATLEDMIEAVNTTKASTPHGVKQSILKRFQEQHATQEEIDALTTADKYASPKQIDDMIEKKLVDYSPMIIIGDSDETTQELKAMTLEERNATLQAEAEAIVSELGLNVIPGMTLQSPDESEPDRFNIWQLNKLEQWIDRGERGELPLAELENGSILNLSQLSQDAITNLRAIFASADLDNLSLAGIEKILELATNFAGIEVGDFKYSVVQDFTNTTGIRDVKHGWFQMDGFVYTNFNNKFVQEARRNILNGKLRRVTEEQYFEEAGAQDGNVLGFVLNTDDTYFYKINYNVNTGTQPTQQSFLDLANGLKDADGKTQREILANNGITFDASANAFKKTYTFYTGEIRYKLTMPEDLPTSIYNLYENLAKDEDGYVVDGVLTNAGFLIENDNIKYDYTYNQQFYELNVTALTNPAVLLIYLQIEQNETGYRLGYGENSLDSNGFNYQPLNNRWVYENTAQTTTGFILDLTGAPQEVLDIINEGKNSDGYVTYEYLEENGFAYNDFDGPHWFYYETGMSFSVLSTETINQFFYLPILNEVTEPRTDTYIFENDKKTITQTDNYIFPIYEEVIQYGGYIRFPSFDDRIDLKSSNINFPQGYLAYNEDHIVNITGATTSDRFGFYINVYNSGALYLTRNGRASTRNDQVIGSTLNFDASRVVRVGDRVEGRGFRVPIYIYCGTPTENNPYLNNVLEGDGISIDYELPKTPTINVAPVVFTQIETAQQTAETAQQTGENAYEKAQEKIENIDIEIIFEE